MPTFTTNPSKSAPPKTVSTLKKTEMSVNAELSCLSRAQAAFEKMTPDARRRAFHWFKSKYSAEWPSEPSY